MTVMDAYNISNLLATLLIERTYLNRKILVYSLEYLNSRVKRLIGCKKKKSS